MCPASTRRPSSSAAGTPSLPLLLLEVPVLLLLLPSQSVVVAHREPPAAVARSNSSALQIFDTASSAASALSPPPTAAIVAKTNLRYASWTIDASYNRGFVHNDFSNPNLLAGAKSLAPSTIRFGGGGNDYLHYVPFDASCNKTEDGDQHVCLNMSHWNSLYSLAKRSDTDFIFGISYDMVQACTDKSQYVWKAEPAVAMIKYIQSKKQEIWGYELGNEVNNRQRSCNTTGGQQAKAFKLFASKLAQLYPDSATRPKLLGPDVGYLDPELYLRDFLGNFSDLYASTYHVYSWLSKRNWNFTMPLDNAVRDGESWYPPLVHQLAPGAQVWAGEDGPVSGGEDGTCGQNNSVCGTYATVPWYANDLGHRAVMGFSQYQRQDLLGGRYSLLGSPHDNEFLGRADAVTIHPDFWVIFMWKRIMGTSVRNVTQEFGPSVRSYMHCGQPPSKHAPAAVFAGLVLVNLNSTHAEKVKLRAPFRIWTLSPPADRFFGADTLLNGKPLPTEIADGLAIDAIPGEAVVHSDKQVSAVTLPPFSVSFVVPGTVDSPAECPN